MKREENFFTNLADIPEKLMKNAEGPPIFEEEYPRVVPISEFPDPQIVLKSAELVGKTEAETSMELVIMQRQRVRMVPQTLVNYERKRETGSFYIYGFERSVYFPNYPARCCCLCTIL